MSRTHRNHTNRATCFAKPSNWPDLPNEAVSRTGCWEQRTRSSRTLFIGAGFVDYRSDLRTLVDLHGDVSSALGWSEASAFGNFLGAFSAAEREAIDRAFAVLVEANRTPEGLRLERYLRFAFARKPEQQNIPSVS